MKQALCVLLLIISNSAFAQKIRFTDTANSWSVVSYHSSEPNVYWPVFSFRGDTVIDGKAYKRMDRVWGTWLCIERGYVREDSILKKVFIKGLHPSSGTIFGAPYTDTIERVLYDYNLKVGDTVRVDAGSHHAKHYVQRIDSTLINGVSHKIWFFRGIHIIAGGGLGGDYTVVEGVGCLDAPLYPVFPHVFEESQNLVCFRNGNSKPLFNPPIQSYNNDCTLDVSLITTTSKMEVLVVPNPVQKGAHFQLSASIILGRLKIFNSTGSLVSSTTIQNTSAINLPSTVAIPGLYFYQITDATRSQTFTGKFVFE